MAIRIKYKEDWDSGAYLPQLQDLWAKQDKSQIDKQQLMSYLRGLSIPAKEGKYSALNEEIRFLQSIAQVRE